tara:strand:- start:10569 stop:11120 length:552 start_codon:yes stop_codon:yes gene_type:complete
MLVKKAKLFISLFSLMFFLSCFEGTDFEQANDVLLTPEIELDLIYFNIEASQFYNPSTSTEILVLKDTTDLDFLGGRDINNILKKADFLFQFTNSIPREFDVSFDFLNTQNQSKYFIQSNIVSGNQTNPVVTTFLEEIDEQEITDLTSANKVVISVAIASSSQNLTGVLNLQSKTTYYLEIDQ